MKRNVFVWCGVCGILAIGMAQPVFAGWEIVDGDGSITLLQEGKLTVMDGQQGGVILDGPANKLIMIDHNRALYARGEVDEFCGKTKAMVQQAMESVPPEYRQMMEQMLGRQDKNSAPPSVVVDKAGPGGTVAGFATTKYTVRVNGNLHEEIWLTDDAGLRKEWQPLAPMMADFNACTGEMGGEATADPENAPEYRALINKGLPVKTVRYQDGTAEVDTEVVRAEQKNLDAALFLPPKGFREVSFSEYLGAAGMGSDE